MLKTVMAQMAAPTQKVEEAISAIGVSMREANGELRSGYDILLDLSLATKDATVSQEELANAEKAAASGKFQYAKVAALMGQFDEIVKNTARSINNEGITLRMAGQQMDTIERKAKMLKATLIDMFSGAGDQGLRATIKGLIDVLNQFLMGLNQVSAPIINMGVALLALKLALIPIQGLYAQLLPLITAKTSATVVETGTIVAETAATEAATVAATEFSMATAMATAGISIIIGALAAYVYHLGTAEKAQMDLTQKQKDDLSIAQQRTTQYQSEADFLETMAQKHEQLTAKINSGKLSNQELTDAKKNLQAVEEAVGLCIDDETKKRMKANGIKATEIDKIIQLINVRQNEVKQQYANQITMSQNAIKGAETRIRAYQAEMNALGALEAAKGKKLAKSGFMETTGMFLNELNPFDKNSSQSNQKKINAVNAKLKADQKLLKDNQELLEQSQEALRQLSAYDGLGSGETGGGAGSSGSGSPNKWLDLFLQKTLAAAEAQDALNQSKARATEIEQEQQSLLIDNARTASEYTQGMVRQKSLIASWEEQQAGINKEIDLYKQAITALEAKQKTLNTSTDAGYEAYQKIGDEINNAKQKVDELTKSEIQLEIQQRQLSVQRLDKALGWVDKLADMGAIDTSQQLALYEQAIKVTDSYEQRLAIMGKIVELGKKELEQEAKKKIDAIKAEIDAYKAASDARIAAIQNEIDALEKRNAELERQQQIEDALLAISEAQSDLTKAKAKLENVKKEKNTRIFQSGRWEYIANPQAVEEAQDAVADANERLSAARKSYNSLMEKLYQEDLQAQIEAEKKKQEEVEKAGQAQIKTLEDGLKKAQDDLAKGGEEINALLRDTVLKNIETTFGEKFLSIYQTVSYYVDLMRSELTSLAADTGLEVKTIGQSVTDKIVGAFGSGGEIPTTGLALVHKGEYMLNNQDVKALGGVGGVKNILSGIRFPAVKAANVVRTSSVSKSVNNDYGVNIQNANFPNVVNGSTLIRNMRQFSQG